MRQSDSLYEQPKRAINLATLLTLMRNAADQEKTIIAIRGEMAELVDNFVKPALRILVPLFLYILVLRNN